MFVRENDDCSCLPIIFIALFSRAQASRSVKTSYRYFYFYSPIINQVGNSRLGTFGYGEKLRVQRETIFFFVITKEKKKRWMEEKKEVGNTLLIFRHRAIRLE